MNIKLNLTFAHLQDFMPAFIWPRTTMSPWCRTQHHLLIKRKSFLKRIRGIKGNEKGENFPDTLSLVIISYTTYLNQNLVRSLNVFFYLRALHPVKWIEIHSVTFNDGCFICIQIVMKLLYKVQFWRRLLWCEILLRGGKRKWIREM